MVDPVGSAACAGSASIAAAKDLLGVVVSADGEDVRSEQLEGVEAPLVVQEIVGRPTEAATRRPLVRRSLTASRRNSMALAAT